MYFTKTSITCFSGFHFESGFLRCEDRNLRFSALQTRNETKVRPLNNRDVKLRFHIADRHFSVARKPALLIGRLLRHVTMWRLASRNNQSDCVKKYLVAEVFRKSRKNGEICVEGALRKIRLRLCKIWSCSNFFCVEKLEAVPFVAKMRHIPPSSATSVFKAPKFLFCLRNRFF